MPGADVESRLRLHSWLCCECCRIELGAGKAGQGAPALSSSASPRDNLSHSQFYRQSCFQLTCKLSSGQPVPAAVERDQRFAVMKNPPSTDSRGLRRT